MESPTPPDLTDERPGEPTQVSVVCIGDDPEFAALLDARLDDRFRIRTGTDHHEVLRSLERADCVVSDDEMPVLSGAELLAEIRTRAPRLPFVLLADSFDSDAATAVREADWTAVLSRRSAATVDGYLSTRIAGLVEHRRADTLAEGALAAVETVSEGVALAADGTFTFADQSFERRLGYETGELVGVSWRGVFTDEELERIEGSRLSAVQNGWRWSGTCAVERADGSVTSVGTTVAGLGDGSLVFVVD